MFARARRRPRLQWLGEDERRRVDVTVEEDELARVREIERGQRRQYRPPFLGAAARRRGGGAPLGATEAPPMPRSGADGSDACASIARTAPAGAREDGRARRLVLPSPSVER